MPLLDLSARSTSIVVGFFSAPRKPIRIRSSRPLHFQREGARDPIDCGMTIYRGQPTLGPSPATPGTQVKIAMVADRRSFSVFHNLKNLVHSHTKASKEAISVAVVMVFLLILRTHLGG